MPARYRRKAPTIRSATLQGEQRGTGGVHARDLAGNPPLDHPEGLAKKGQIAPSVRSARGVRGGGHSWRRGQANGRLILLREALEKREISRVRSARLPAPGEAPEQGMAGEVRRGRGGRRGRQALRRLVLL